MNEQNTALALVNEDDIKFIVDLTAPAKTQFCSVVPKTEADKAMVFKAMNNPEKRISDCINMTINVKDVYVEVVQCVNKETGELSDCPRIVLIDDKGVGYQCVSIGMYSALKKVFSVYGVPTYEKALAIKIVQVTKGERKLLTFDVVSK
jgi:hypothetical protein